MLRYSRFVLLTLLSLQACENNKKAQTPDAGPVLPTPSPHPTTTPDVQASIEFFYYDAPASLEAQVPKVNVKLHWKSNVSDCSLKVGTETHAVEGQGMLSAAMSGPVEAGLVCGTASKNLNIPVLRKMSIVRFDVQAVPEGEQVEWESFAANSCTLSEAAQAIHDQSVPATGKLLITTAQQPLNLTLRCEGGHGGRVSSTFDVAAQLGDSEKLQIQTFAGPTEPVSKGKRDEKVPVPLRWKVAHASQCRLIDSSDSIVLPASSGQTTLNLTPGSIRIECVGPRFQKAEQSLLVNTQKKLEILQFAAPASGLFGSSRFHWEYVDFEVHGASSCKAKADNDNKFETWEGDHIESLSKVAIKVNESTKEINLSCSNSRSETVTATLPVKIKSRIDVHFVKVDPETITQAWTDTSEHEVTVSWKAEHFKSCDVIRAGQNEDVIIRTFTPDQDAGHLTTKVNSTTSFRVKCIDADGLKAYHVGSVTFERQPSLAITPRAKKIEIEAHGFRFCAIETADLELKWTVQASDPRRLEIKSSTHHPYLMQDTAFEVSCQDVNFRTTRRTVVYKSPDPTYFVLRKAEIKSDRFHVKAAWNLGSEFQNCALYQQDGNKSSTLLNSIAGNGSQALSMDLADLMAASTPESLTFFIQCQSHPDKRWSKKPLSPELACSIDDDDLLAILKIPYSLGKTLTCEQMIEKLAKLEEIELTRYTRHIEFLYPYLTKVKKMKVEGSVDILPIAPYLPDLETLEYDFEYGNNPEAIKMLSQLKNLHLAFTGYNIMDLRFIRKIWPKLQAFTLQGQTTAESDVIPKFKESLQGLPLKQLALSDVALKGNVLSVLSELPLIQLGLSNIACYHPGSLGSSNDCFGRLPNNIPKMPLTAVKVEASNVSSLEKIYSADTVERMEFLTYQSSSSVWRPDSPRWREYKKLRHLKLWNEHSLSSYSNEVFKGVKVLEVSYPLRNRMGELGRVPVQTSSLSSNFPGIEQLSLTYASLESLHGLWKLDQLKQLTLSDVSITHWDIPSEGRILERLTLEKTALKPIWKSLEGLRVTVLNVDTMELNADELSPGVIETLDLRQAKDDESAQTQLESVFGKVKTIQLSNLTALRIRSAVKSCNLRRVVNGTTLVHRDLDADWQACDAL